MTSLPRRVEVLHEGRWVAGWLEDLRRDDRGWRGCVRYSVAPGLAFLQWRPAAELRRALEPGR